VSFCPTTNIRTLRSACWKLANMCCWRSRWVWVWPNAMQRLPRPAAPAAWWRPTHERRVARQWGAVYPLAPRGETGLLQQQYLSPQKLQLTAFFRWIGLVNSSFCAHQQGHLNGDNAPHPIEPRWRTPPALLLLALRSPQRRHLAGRSQARGLPSSRCPGVRGHTWSRSAQPCRPQSSQRLAFFALSRRARAHLESQRSAVPTHPIAAHSGASNCGFPGH